MLCRQNHSPAKQFIGHFTNGLIMILHVRMDFIPAASANRIMRMILHQLFPQIMQVIFRIRAGTTCRFQHRIQRLQTIIQPVLRKHVQPFQIRTGGQGSLKELTVSAHPQFAVMSHHRNLMFLNVIAHVCHIISHFDLANRSVNLVLIQLFQDRQQIFLCFQMIYAVHQQQIGRHCYPFKTALHNLNQFFRNLRIFRKTLCIVVPIFHMYRQSLRSVRSLPYKLGRQLFGDDFACFVLMIAFESSAENKVINSEIVKNLR